MSDTTTIKVPRELRDRIAVVAHQQHKTLAAVIAQALDDSENRAFWFAVRRENASLTADERTAALTDHTLADGLADDIDNAVSIRNGW